MKELKVGLKAPSFSLKNQNGETVSLKNLEEEYIVLFFYPKDNTPGCSIEAKNFTSNQKKFTKNSIATFGVSGGDQKSKENFYKKANLGVTLLADEDGAIGTKYGAYGDKIFMGKKFIGFHRKTIIIGPDRKIAKIYDKVKPAEHAEEVLDDILALKES